MKRDDELHCHEADDTVRAIHHPRCSSALGVALHPTRLQHQSANPCVLPVHAVKDAIRTILQFL